jgi:hypothetical protein
VENIIIPNIKVSIAGLPKSGKNHLAYSFPAPIKVYCFNGGASLVARKFPDIDIKVHDFVLPIIESTADEWALPIWEEFYQEYKEDAMSGSFKTLVLDTATEVENVCQQAVLEDLQDKAEGRGRNKQKLATTDYLARNLRMKALFDLAQNQGINLVALSYLKEKWVRTAGEDKATNTGELVIDGWARTEAQADINIELAPKIKGGKKVSVATVKSNRFDWGFDEKSFENTNYNELYAILIEPWVNS